MSDDDPFGDWFSSGATTKTAPLAPTTTATGARHAVSSYDDIFSEMEASPSPSRPRTTAANGNGHQQQIDGPSSSMKPISVHQPDANGFGDFHATSTPTAPSPPQPEQSTEALAPPVVDDGFGDFHATSTPTAPSPPQPEQSAEAPAPPVVDDGFGDFHATSTPTAPSPPQPEQFTAVLAPPDVDDGFGDFTETRPAPPSQSSSSDSVDVSWLAALRKLCGSGLPQPVAPADGVAMRIDGFATASSAGCEPFEGLGDVFQHLGLEKRCENLELPAVGGTALRDRLVAGKRGNAHLMSVAHARMPSLPERTSSSVLFELAADGTTPTAAANDSTPRAASCSSGANVAAAGSELGAVSRSVAAPAPVEDTAEEDEWMKAPPLPGPFAVRSRVRAGPLFGLFPLKGLLRGLKVTHATSSE